MGKMPGEGIHKTVNSIHKTVNPKKRYIPEAPVKHIRCRNYDTCLHRAAKTDALFDCGECGAYDPFPLPEWYEILRKDVDGIDLKRLAEIRNL